MDKKPVNTEVDEPLLHVVGDFHRRANQRPLTARPGEPFIELADGEFLLARPAKHIAHRGLTAERAVMLRISGRGPSISYSDRSNPPTAFESSSSPTSG